MSWYKIAQKKNPFVTLCANCGKVSKDSEGVLGEKRFLTKQEQKDMKGVTFSHGLCYDCCVKLYGLDVCKEAF